MIATNDVLYHGPERRPLQDVMTCIREGCCIEEAGLRLEANAERHLKSPAEMARLFSRWPAALERTVEVAERVAFDLSQLRYEYPDEPVPPGRRPWAHLTDLAWEGAAWRYPQGAPQKVADLLRAELDLIEELDYPNYFLTVHDIVRWARDKGILCQGRGSAANSAVCFCLGITAVDPTRPKHDVLFARFISKERDEPPDIDVDFEHERRELVMQVRLPTLRQGAGGDLRHGHPLIARAAPSATSGKALGLTEDVTAALAGTVWGSWGDGLPDEHIAQAGLDPESPQIPPGDDSRRRAPGLSPPSLPARGRFRPHQAAAGRDLPDRQRRHEGPHLHRMGQGRHRRSGPDEGRCPGAGDAGRRSANPWRCSGSPTWPTSPKRIRRSNAMLSRADSVGVFQVESRAQMSMLPRP